MFFGIISISDDFKLALFSRNKSIHLYKFEAMTSHDIKVLLNRVQSKGLIAFEVKDEKKYLIIINEIIIESLRLMSKEIY